jgi:hypothetical protein
MAEDERMEILKKLEKGEISAARAEEMLEGLDAGVDVEPPEAEAEGKVITDITEWSPDGPVGELRLSSFVGDVVARAGEQTLVIATVKARAKKVADAKKLFDKVELTFDEKDGKAHVKADMTKSILDLFRGAKVWVDFDVTVPADVPFVASYGTGKLATEGIARVGANGGNGKVETDAAYVDVNLGNGKLLSRGARELEVNGGNLKVFVGGADDLQKVRLNVGNGFLELKQALLPENADYAFNFGSGKVSAEFGRRPTDCLIKIESLAGKLDTDVPFDKKGTTMVYADGEAKANVKINAAHSNVEIKVKEDK